MKTIEDLPFLKAQAAELERLIRIAPPSAVIAKFQYEEQLSDVREAITGVVKAARQVSVSMGSPPEIEKLISPNEIPSVCGAEIQYAIEEVIPVLREKLSKASDKFKEEIRRSENYDRVVRKASAHQSTATSITPSTMIHRETDRKSTIVLTKSALDAPDEEKAENPAYQTPEEFIDACEEAIRERAFRLWEEAGCPSGDGFEFWVEAEREIVAARTDAMRFWH